MRSTRGPARQPMPPLEAVVAGSILIGVVLIAIPLAIAQDAAVGDASVTADQHVARVVPPAAAPVTPPTTPAADDDLDAICPSSGRPAALPEPVGPAEYRLQLDGQVAIDAAGAVATFSIAPPSVGSTIRPIVRVERMGAPRRVVACQRVDLDQTYQFPEIPTVPGEIARYVVGVFGPPTPDDRARWLREAQPRRDTLVAEIAPVERAGTSRRLVQQNTLRSADPSPSERLTELLSDASRERARATLDLIRSVRCMAARPSDAADRQACVVALRSQGGDDTMLERFRRERGCSGAPPAGLMPDVQHAMCGALDDAAVALRRIEDALGAYFLALDMRLLAAVGRLRATLGGRTGDSTNIGRARDALTALEQLANTHTANDAAVASAITAVNDRLRALAIQTDLEPIDASDLSELPGDVRSQVTSVLSMLDSPEPDVGAQATQCERLSRLRWFAARPESAARLLARFELTSADVDHTIQVLHQDGTRSMENVRSGAAMAMFVHGVPRETQIRVSQQRGARFRGDPGQLIAQFLPFLFQFLRGASVSAPARASDVCPADSPRTETPDDVLLPLASVGSRVATLEPFDADYAYTLRVCPALGCRPDGADAANTINVTPREGLVGMLLLVDFSVSGGPVQTPRFEPTGPAGGPEQLMTLAAHVDPASLFALSVLIGIRIQDVGIVLGPTITDAAGTTFHQFNSRFVWRPFRGLAFTAGAGFRILPAPTGALQYGNVIAVQVGANGTAVAPSVATQDTYAWVLSFGIALDMEILGTAANDLISGIQGQHQ